jgi:hypothetical protein
MASGVARLEIASAPPVCAYDAPTRGSGVLVGVIVVVVVVVVAAGEAAA